MEQLKDGLSLCIIVGPKESFELERCLKSIEGPLFDEICVTVTSDDDSVKKIADEMATDVSYFEWCQDFGKARNFCFNQATYSHIMWLDADDVLKPESYKKLLEIKSELHKYDMVMLDYIYAHDADDKPLLVLPRERIVRNCSYIKWHDPIHEYLNMDECKSIHRLEGVAVDHYRIKPFNPDRNLSILAEQYNAGDRSPRTEFYYGKELMDNGSFLDGLKVLESLIASGKGYQDNLTVAAIKVARYYLTVGSQEDAKTYAMRGIGFNPKYAENYVILGDIARESGDNDLAIDYYESARSKKLDGGMSQIYDFYNFIPTANIALIHLHLGNSSEAVKYAELALTYKPDNDQIIEVLKKAKNDLALKSNSKVIADNKTLTTALENLGYLSEISYDNGDVASVKLRKKGNGIAWLLTGLHYEDPATRIRRLNVHENLVASGVESKIVSNYKWLDQAAIIKELHASSVVIFTDHGEQELSLIRELKSLGKKIVFDKCEEIFDNPYQNECMAEAHALVCCSNKLAEIAISKGFKNTFMIPDGIESHQKRPDEQYEDRYSKPRALYMGMGGNSFLASEYLKPAIDAAGYDLVVITEWDSSDEKWDLHRWPDQMRSCDVVLCPQRVDVQSAKSNVKATAAMALGMPIICSPLPVYSEIIQSGHNGFICESLKDWEEALISLKSSEKRRKIGTKAFESIEDYLPETIVKSFRNDLMGYLYSYGNKEYSAPEIVSNYRETVDLIIPNYNNVEYLKLFISSILMNTQYPFRIIISDAGSNSEMWEYLRSLRGIVVLGKEGTRKNFSEACNAGISASTSKYFAILNSDMVVSKCWLTSLVKRMEEEDRLAACGVLSNCDKGWLYGNKNIPGSPDYPMRLVKSGVDLYPGMKMGQIKPHIDELYEFMAESNKVYKDKFVEQPWVAAYATLFARSAIEEVGGFDENFKNGCEDLDLCRRLSSSGYRIGQAIDSFVFHFGGISRGAYQNENMESYNAEDRYNHDLYHKKWEYKKVVIWTGPAWEPWTKEDVDKGMAGSETWAAYLAIELAKRGYAVVIYNQLREEDRGIFLRQDYDVCGTIPEENRGIKKGFVAYRDYTNLEEDLKWETIDYFISSRSVEPLRSRIHAKKRYVMIHDIWLNGDSNYDILQWKVDGYGYLSEWHREFLHGHHRMPLGKMFLTANGVNVDLYSDADTYIKKNQIVYSSSPDRGLLQLLKIFPRLREIKPDLTLIVAYGFYNWESSVKAHGDANGQKHIDLIKEHMNQPGVTYVGRVSKEELSVYQKESKWWLYPTGFTETFCISAVENGLARNAILTTDLAGLKTTVGGGGILLDCQNEEFLEEFYKAARNLIESEDLTLEYSEKAYNKMVGYTWDRIVDEWLREFKAIQ